MGDNLVRNAVLNFISRAMIAGVKTNVFARRGLEFFSREAILEAKEIIYRKSELGERVIKHVKDEDNFMDIAKTFARCAKEKRQLPEFVIFEPEEVPACNEEIAACVVSTVNEMNCNFNGLLDHLNQKPLPWSEGNPVAAQANESTPSPLSYSVVLKKPPPTVATAEERKNFLSNICGDALNDNDFELRRRKYEWRFVTKNKSKAAVLAASINKKSPETLASVKIRLSSV